VNKHTEGTIPNDTLVNKPTNGTTPNDGYKIPTTVVVNHLIQREIEEEVITIQALEEKEHLVEYKIYDTMHATLEANNQDFKFIRELIQPSPALRIMLH